MDRHLCVSSLTQKSGFWRGKSGLWCIHNSRAIPKDRQGWRQGKNSREFIKETTHLLHFGCKRSIYSMQMCHFFLTILHYHLGMVGGVGEQKVVIANSLIILTTTMQPLKCDTPANLFNSPMKFGNITWFHYLQGNTILVRSYLRLMQLTNVL